MDIEGMVDGKRCKGRQRSVWEMGHQKWPESVTLGDAKRKKKKQMTSNLRRKE